MAIQGALHSCLNLSNQGKTIPTNLTICCCCQEIHQDPLFRELFLNPQILVDCLSFQCGGGGLVFSPEKIVQGSVIEEICQLIKDQKIQAMDVLVHQDCPEDPQTIPNQTPEEIKTFWQEKLFSLPEIIRDACLEFAVKNFPILVRLWLVSHNGRGAVFQIRGAATITAEEYQITPYQEYPQSQKKKST